MIDVKDGVCKVKLCSLDLLVALHRLPRLTRGAVKVADGAWVVYRCNIPESDRPLIRTICPEAHALFVVLAERGYVVVDNDYSEGDWGWALLVGHPTNDNTTDVEEIVWLAAAIDKGIVYSNGEWDKGSETEIDDEYWSEKRQSQLALATHTIQKAFGPESGISFLRE